MGAAANAHTQPAYGPNEDFGFSEMSDDEETHERFRTEDLQVLKVPRAPLLETRFWSRLLERPRPFPCWTIPNTHFAAFRLLMSTLIPDADFPGAEQDGKLLAIIIHAAHLGVKYHMPHQVTELGTELVRHLFGQFLFQVAVSRYPRRDLKVKANHLIRAWNILTYEEVLKFTCVHPLEIAMVFAVYVPFAYVEEYLDGQDADLVRDVEYFMGQHPESRRADQAAAMITEYRDGVENGYTGPFAKRLCERLEIPVPEWYEAEIANPPTGALRDIKGDLEWELNVLATHPWNKPLSSYKADNGGQANNGDQADNGGQANNGV
ncbi:hypothetical protein CDD82_1724 [Ophiocordyceps australis]|uniref:Uncharacterized protein n=1 Tax=Ophiocordyceps australis TaxID=1399860 RepID=A0A2C5XAJ9_9HYPO|nr:hypothetical protein CDD82_1724 [Ophiocordyceps australis]